MIGVLTLHSRQQNAGTVRLGDQKLSADCAVFDVFERNIRRKIYIIAVSGLPVATYAHRDFVDDNRRAHKSLEGQIVKIAISHAGLTLEPVHIGIFGEYLNRAARGVATEQCSLRTLQHVDAAYVGQLLDGAGSRSEERRVGQECVSTCRSRWSPYH